MNRMQIHQTKEQLLKVEEENCRLIEEIQMMDKEINLLQRTLYD